MSYLTINGIDTLARVDSTSISYDRIGAGITRAQDGTARNNFNARKLHLKTKTAPMTERSAAFLAAIIDGVVDHWMWASDGYSDKGLGPSSSSGVTYGTGGLIENGLSLAATTGQITYAGALSTPTGQFTACVSRFESGAWVIYIVISAATGIAVYRDAVLVSGSFPSWFSVSGTTLKIQNTSASVDQYSGLTIFGSACEAADVAGLDDFFGTFIPLRAPSLLCTGTFASSMSGYIAMLGTASDSTVAPAAVSGSLADAVSLSFELVEV